MFDPCFLLFFHVVFGGKGKERRTSNEKLLRHKTFPTPSRNASENGKMWEGQGRGENSHGERK